MSLLKQYLELDSFEKKITSRLIRNCQEYQSDIFYDESFIQILKKFSIKYPNCRIDIKQVVRCLHRRHYHEMIHNECVNPQIVYKYTLRFK